jgi:methylated-DNA-[protein]-cysteine S-methyltransferase
MMKTFTGYYASPIGLLEISSSQRGIRSITFVKYEEKFIEVNDHIHLCLEQLKEYFSGERKEFSLELDQDGTTFQKQVWKELVSLGYGSTSSYGFIASQLGKPNASRAVGSANGKNPIAIVVPCHRVIGSNGKLTGYNGEVWRKEWLLHHEQPHTASLF